MWFQWQRQQSVKQINSHLLVLHTLESNSYKSLNRLLTPTTRLLSVIHWTDMNGRKSVLTVVILNCNNKRMLLAFVSPAYFSTVPVDGILFPTGLPEKAWWSGGEAWIQDSKFQDLHQDWDLKVQDQYSMFRDQEWGQALQDLGQDFEVQYKTENKTMNNIQLN